MNKQINIIVKYSKKKKNRFKAFLPWLFFRNFDQSVCETNIALMLVLRLLIWTTCVCVCIYIEGS